VREKQRENRHISKNQNKTGKGEFVEGPNKKPLTLSNPLQVTVRMDCMDREYCTSVRAPDNWSSSL
jgi:hypothetical protein